MHGLVPVSARYPTRLIFFAGLICSNRHCVFAEDFALTTTSVISSFCVAVCLNLDRSFIKASCISFKERLPYFLTAWRNRSLPNFSPCGFSVSQRPSVPMAITIWLPFVPVLIYLFLTRVIPSVMRMARRRIEHSPIFMVPSGTKPNWSQRNTIFCSEKYSMNPIFKKRFKI